MRKLYLKIVAAIWIVMLASSIGAAFVVHAVAPERYVAHRPPPHVVLDGHDDRAGHRPRRLAFLARRPPVFWVPLSIAIALSAILSFGIARYLVRPLRSMEQVARRLSEGDLSARVGPAVGNRGDEIADFAAAFDRMATRIQSLVRAHKVLLRDVSHELRSPLARALAALSLARQRTDGTVDPELDRLEAEIERLNGMIGKLLTFSRLDSEEREMQRERVDLAGLLAEIVADAEFEARSNRRSVELRDSGPLIVLGDPGLLASCFENVIRNALRHTRPDTTVEITASPDAARGSARVAIRDHGDGVPAGELERIFTPFHRLENGGGEGSGIGLAIAKRAVELHGGEIVAANAPGGGLLVTLSLPLSP